MDHRGISTAYRNADFSPAGNPSTIQNLEPAAHDADWHGFFTKSGDHFINTSRMLVDDSSFHHHQPRSIFSLISKPTSLQQDFYENPLRLKSSKYMIPARELLNEFCCVGGSVGSPKPCKPKGFNDGGSSSSSAWNQTLDPLELQRLKARLLSMLEEVDRRYTRYREQMKSVVSSFEAVAGEGAPAVYSTMASRAMSIHFRSLRDGIVGQIRATRNAMGEEDSSVAGATRGETPRLRMLEQRIRQQKAIQQGSAMENHPWRPQRGLPERSVSVLRAWLFEHFLHPYPSDVDKHILARQTGLSRSQVSNWFINARVRLWKPMVEEMYMEETKDLEDDDNSYSGGTSSLLHSNPNPNPNPSASEDEKPFPPQQMNDSGLIASIINSSQREDPTSNFRMMAEHMDFASYDHEVSLTLGLHQHSPFFDRESMGNFPPEPEPEPFPFMDGEPQNLPYKNLGAQLLHYDLAG